MKNFFVLCFAALGTALLLFAFTNDPGPSIAPGEVPGTIEMTAKTQGETKLYFDKWQFESFSLKKGAVEKIKADVLIDTRSLSSEWTDLVKSIKKKPDYFYVKKFPTARVKVNGAQATEDGKWMTEAKVTIKDQTHLVPLTFTISEEAPYDIVGDAVILRKKFDFTGDGPKWEVPVHFEATVPEE